MRNSKRLVVLVLTMLAMMTLLVVPAFAEGEEAVEVTSNFYMTFWSLLPPIIAIALALITKEVYTSLFVGIFVGGLLYSNFSFEGTLLHAFNDGIVASIADPYNVGILVFLVVLGIMVMLMNKAGGSAAFGRWASEHIKTRAGAQIATIALGVLIFIDDYFNCLTVGSVMRPVSDKSKISRASAGHVTNYRAYKENYLKEYGRTERYPSRGAREMPRWFDVDDGWFSEFKKQDGYKILLSHHPEYWSLREPKLCEKKINLVLSGHAHGGQIRLFGKGIYAPGQGFFPEYTKGVWMGKNGWLVVSTGLANTSSMVPRLFNPPEVVYVRLKTSSCNVSA